MVFGKRERGREGGEGEGERKGGREERGEG